MNYEKFPIEIKLNKTSCSKWFSETKENNSKMYMEMKLFKRMINLYSVASLKINKSQIMNRMVVSLAPSHRRTLIGGTRVFFSLLHTATCKYDDYVNKSSSIAQSASLVQKEVLKIAIDIEHLSTRRITQRELHHCQ